MRGRDATRSGDQLMPDEEGQELLDVCAARCEAQQSPRTIRATVGPLNYDLPLPDGSPLPKGVKS
jgi:hypothetical protein